METLSNCVMPDQASNLANIKCEIESETDLSRDGASASKHFQQDHDQLLFFNDYDFSDHIQPQHHRPIDDDRVLATPPPSSHPDLSITGSSRMQINNPFSSDVNITQTNSCSPCVTLGMSVAVARVAPMSKLASSQSSSDSISNTDPFSLCDRNSICSQVVNNSTLPNNIPATSVSSTTAATGDNQAFSKDKSKIAPPKKPLTPYMRFSKMIWQEVKHLNPGMSVCEVGAAIGQMWRNMSDQDKKSYTVDFAVDKARYDDELQSYLSITGLQASDLVNIKQKTKRLGREKGQGRKANIHLNTLNSIGYSNSSACNNAFSSASNNSISTFSGSSNTLQSESTSLFPGNNAINSISSTGENTSLTLSNSAENSLSSGKVAGVVDFANQMLVIKNLNDDGLRQQLFPNISWSSGTEDPFMACGVESGITLTLGNSLNGAHQQHSFINGNTATYNNSISSESAHTNSTNSGMAIIGESTNTPAFPSNVASGECILRNQSGIKLEPFDSMNWEDPPSVEALLAIQTNNDTIKRMGMTSEKPTTFIKTEDPSASQEGISILDQSQQLELLPIQQQNPTSTVAINITSLAHRARDINNNANNRDNNGLVNHSLPQGQQSLEPGEVVLPFVTNPSNKQNSLSSFLSFFKGTSGLLSDPEKLLLRSALAEKIGELERLKKELDQAYSIINQLKQQNDFFLQHWNQQQQIQHQQQQLQLQQLLQQRHLHQLQQQQVAPHSQHQPLQTQLQQFSQQQQALSQHQQIQQMRIQQSQQQLLQQLQLQQFQQLCQQQLQNQLQQQQPQNNAKAMTNESDAL